MRADIRRRPFRDGAFDLVCSFKVLAHVPDPRRAVGEMARVTRPGGLVFAEFYNRASLRSLARRIKGARPVADGTTDREVYTRYNRWREIPGMVPPLCRLERVRGARIWTPAPFILRIPLLGRIVAALERASASGPLRRFAGFVILEMRRAEAPRP
ncbi:MAG: class I SAM-dependent methyltransferase [bacterium]|nr:class I SAM-dependent methyltransferase [bacterium]